MKAMTNFTLRSLSVNKVRTVVTIAGVVLAAALLTAVLTSFTSVTDYLVRAEEASNGTWMAEARYQPTEDNEKNALTAEEDSAVEAWATLQDAGFASLDSNLKSQIGSYLALLCGDGQLERVTGIRASEGRMPTAPGEIMLPELWKTKGGAKLGDQVTLNVGTRRAVLVEDVASNSVEIFSGEADSLETEPLQNRTINDGTVLDSSIGHLDSVVDEGVFDEELVDVSSQTYTIVGFYGSGVWQLSVGTGFAGLTVGQPAVSGPVSFFMELAGQPESRQAVIQEAENLFPDAEIEVHANLLRFKGVADNGLIWQTFFSIVVLLAIVVMVACISLIYNAFAISVAERIRQFGLLASIGASHRQLRRSVFLEAALMACVGVPIGIALGLGGTAIAFAALGPSISGILGNAQVPFQVAIQPWVILFAALLTILTVLISAWIPALRASRTSPIDALRQVATIHVSRRAQRKLNRSDCSAQPWRNKRLGGRIFGIGGQLASLNHSRSSSKGRAASISLAVAIVLLMTAGSLNTQLGTLTDAIGNTSESDIDLISTFDSSDPTLMEGNHIEEICSKIYKSACEVPGTEALGWSVGSNRLVKIPKSMAGNALEQPDRGNIAQSDSFIEMANLIYLEPAEFEAYAAQNNISLPSGDTTLGVNNTSNTASVEISSSSEGEVGETSTGETSTEENTGVIPAIAVVGDYDNDGQNYIYQEFFRNPGTMEVVMGAKVDDQASVPVTITFDQKGDAQLATIVPSEAAISGDHSFETIDITTSQLACVPVKVEGLAQEIPTATTSLNGVTLVLPTSVLGSLLLPADDLRFVAAFNAEDHAEATNELRGIPGPMLEEAGLSVSYTNAYDYVDEQESARMTVTVVSTFCFLFTFILTLIALANVFNTITNGLILRRREFAVMRSIGMDRRTFRRMIIWECLGYGARGLIPGVIISLLVSYLLFYAIGLSVRGLTYTLPWQYLLLSVVLVGVVMVISVVYALRRCRTDDIASALRAE